LAVRAGSTTHTTWISTSAPLFFCTSGKETVENLKTSPGQLAPCQEKRIKRREIVSSAGCKVLVLNAGFLLASMSSDCRFRPIECSYCCPPKTGGCRVVAIIQQRTWTNGKARDHLSSLQRLLMQLCALETHIRISRNLKKCVDLMRNRRSGPEPSPRHLQAQARGPKISGNLLVGCNGTA